MTKRRGAKRGRRGPYQVAELSEREKVCLDCSLSVCKPDSAACPYRRWRPKAVLLRRGAASAPEATDAT